MLKKDDFKPVTLEDRELFLHHYSKYSPVHSDNTFTNLVCWNHYAHYEYAFRGKNLILASTINGSTTYRSPIGPTDPHVLKDILDIARREGGDRAILVFGDDARDRILQFNPSLTLYPERDFYDYIYRISDLALLPGKRYQTIRKALNRFKRDCSYETDMITEDNLNEVFEFLDKWCEWKHCEEKPVLNFEKDAVYFAIRHFFELDLTGLIIRVDGRIAACAIVDELHEDCAVVHFEKGLPECKDVYKSVNNEMAKYLLGKYQFINRESDLGMEGLREAKMRYHPDHFVPVYYTKCEEIGI